MSNTEIEMNRLKNAPLTMPADRDSFVRWATEEPDGWIAAGWQPPHSRLEPLGSDTELNSHTPLAQNQTLLGTVKGGVVVLEGAILPPDGARVEVRLVDEAQSPTWRDVFQGIMGNAPELPTDISENHDHYAHRAPKGIDNE